MFTISGNHLVIQSRMSRTSTFWLVTRTEYRLVPYSPACYLRTLGLTYITPQSSLHSVPFTDIYLFHDGNNKGKPFCTALLSLCSSIPRLRSVRTQSSLCSCLQWSSTIQKPIELNRGSFAVIFGSSDLFIEQLLALAAECQLLKLSFRAWQKYCILSLLSLGRFSSGILINISSKKNAFVRVFTLTIRHFETGLFKKSGKIR